MQWTEEQRAAIEARGSDLLLSAAAGSGKTAVLVERVERLIEEGADIERMLIVTFTRASAADMKAHLVERLQALSAEQPRLREQAERVERAAISTIHAFCADFLHGAFQAAGVDPAFRIGEGPETAVLREKALDAAMRECYAAPDDDLTALTEARTAKEVRELTLSLTGFLMERPDPWGWLDQRIESLARGEDCFSGEIAAGARRILREARLLARYALEAAGEGAELYLPAAENDLMLLDAMLAAPDYESLQAMLAAPGFMRLPSKRGTADDPDCQRYKELREAVKDRVKAAGKRMPLVLSDALSDLPACAAELRGLRRLARAMEEQFSRQKAARSMLTFSDLEHKTLAALSVPAVRDSVRARYDYVFVDEYQDVSDVQEAILRAVSRGDNLFCVGDVKQSIYRFRHAEPALFTGKAEAFRRGEGGRLLALTRNFRSRASVLGFANEVFARSMNGGDADILYDELHALRPGAAYEGADPDTELILVTPDPEEKPEDEGGEETEAQEEARQLKDAEAEALCAAGRIRELLGTPCYDAKKGAFRPLAWRDFVILTRRAKGIAQQVVAVLAEEGIPAVADVSGSFFDVLEVRLALALLRLIDNKRSDPDWIAVLRSPAVGLTSEELARVRLAAPKGAFCDAVAACAEGGEGDLSRKLSAFMERLDRWRELKEALPLAQLAYVTLRDTGLISWVGALPGGAQRQANLDALMHRAAQYESALPGGLNGFLAYVDQLSASAEDTGEAHTLSENDDVVRVMTVHKSKGLEFPVVIGIQLGARLAGGRPGALCFHKSLGVGLTHIDNRLNTRRDTLPRQAIEERVRREDYAESLRVLYVMLTRAKERLILIGSAKNPDERLRDAFLTLEEPVYRRDYLDVLLPAILRMPGSEPLWERLWRQPRLHEGAPRVSCRLTSRSGMRISARAEGQSALERMEEAMAGPWGPVDEAFRWVYPHREEAAIPVKLTASGLSHEIDAEGPRQVPELTERPAFLAEDMPAMTGAERGTALHAALSGLELGPLAGLTGEALRAETVRQLDALAASGRLTAAQRESIDPFLLTRFLTSPLGQRMLRSEQVRREWMFTLALPSREATGMESGEDVLVQGQIDGCFMEDGGWILLDYKSDRPDDSHALLEKYTPQLRLYEKALTRLTGIPVREVWICLLRSGEQMELNREEAKKA